MRFLRILALSAGALWLGSCSDDGGGAIANDDIGWYVGCSQGSTGCGSLPYHDQKTFPKPRFKVTCKKVGSLIEFTITDPGTDDDLDTTTNETRPGGSITVANGDATTNKCDVTVREYPSRDAASPLSYRGRCKGYSPDEVCTLTGQFNTGGWVWAGTLVCDGLVRVNAVDQARYTLFSAAGAGMPVQIAVDNCE